MFIDDVFVTVGSCSFSHNIKHSLGYSSVLIRTLMSMFFLSPCSCESRTERREPVHAGKTPSSPLSPTALRLLTEFGLRYGVVGGWSASIWVLCVQ